MTVCCSYYQFIVYTSFFFFKQKTAYEMRISDWSSDVCSSDLSGTSSLGSPRTRTSRRSAASRSRRRSRPHRRRAPAGWRRVRLRRSEEHTSELQSLMRISYAVFCLKKKKPQKIRIHHSTSETMKQSILHKTLNTYKHTRQT